MNSTKPLENAVQILRQGGVIAYPTEAVYGLGCDPRNAAAITRLLHIKQRPAEKGLILIAASLAQLTPFIAPLDEATHARVTATWPGPVTWLVSAHPEVSSQLRGAHVKIAVRVTAHPFAAELCRAFGGALVSTSANRGGQAPARSAQEVRAQFAAEVDFILDLPIGQLATPTEIRDAESGAIIRPA